jgi:type IX secretion system PorP/SprF family membrane protein
LNRILYRFAAFVLVLITNQFVSGQDTYNYTQFFINPSLVNPAYTGIDGQPAAFLSYRKQWMGFEGAPSIGSLSVQAPLPTRLSVGLNFANDSRGVIKTSSFLFSNSYYIPTAPDTYVRFGFSLGAAWNKVDVNALNFGSIGDDVLTDLLSSNFTLVGNAGLAFQTKTFQIGASIPNIFQPAYLSKDAFTVSQVKPFEAIIFQSSYRWYFSQNKLAFEPTVLYRFNNSMPSQLEVGGVLHMNNVAWIGGSYKQHFGISAMIGLKPSHLSALGYSYTMKNTGINELNSPTHEIQLAILFGVRNKKIPMYSFVNVEKEKGKRDPTHEKQKYYARAGNKGNQTTASVKGKSNGKATPQTSGGPRGKTTDPLDPGSTNTNQTNNQSTTGNTQTKTNPTTGNTQTATNPTTGNTQTKTNPTTGNTQTTTNPTTGNTQTTTNPTTGNTQTTTNPTTGNTQTTTNPTTGNTQTKTNPTTGNSQTTTNPTTGNTQTTTNPTTGNTQTSTNPTTGNTQTKTNPTTGNTQTTTNPTTGNTQTTTNPTTGNTQTTTNPTTGTTQTTANPNTPVVLTEEQQQQHEEEVINRLDDHAENPTETHEEEHPHAERHEFVKRGEHVSEMDLGDYVIVGVFRSEANAKRVSDGYRNLGFSEVDYGFQSGKNLWFVHIAGSDDIEEARSARNKYRKMKMFKDAWLLTVHQ